MNFGLNVCSALVPPTSGLTREIWTALVESVDPIDTPLDLYLKSYVRFRIAEGVRAHSPVELHLLDNHLQSG